MDPLFEKIQIIRNEGEEAFAKNAVNPFKGFTEEMIGNRFFVGMRFTAQSEWGIYKSSIKPLIGIEEKSDFYRFYAAFRNFPFHATVLEGRYEGSDLKKRDEIFSLIPKHKYFLEVCKTLQKIKIPFDYFAIDKGGALLLAASEIPSQVVLARGILEEIYRENSLTPLPIVNLLHVTLARIMQFDSNEEQIGIFSEIDRKVGAVTDNLVTLGTMHMCSYDFFS